MNVLYVCSFSLAEGGGKSRATSQKLDALSRLVNELYVCSFPYRANWVKVFALPLFEFYVCLLLLLKRPEVYISRGFVGWLSIRFAKVINVRTVREVHADLAGEIDLLKLSRQAKYVLRIYSNLSISSDKFADIRIFNNPDLMAWFHRVYGERRSDGYVHNGYCEDGGTEFTKEQARRIFRFSESSRILAFVGSASEWHGLDLLVKLQEEFIRFGDGISIVCGGGKVASSLDPNRVLINLSPLDEFGCASLIKASDLCLLPVKNNRVSPGSPLKLYDYILNGAWVAAQSNTNGYSDEVENLGVGFSVDFQNPTLAREAIKEFFDSKGHLVKPKKVDVSWKVRMQQWLHIIDAAPMRSVRKSH